MKIVHHFPIGFLILSSMCLNPQVSKAQNQDCPLPDNIKSTAQKITVGISIFDEPENIVPEGSGVILSGKNKSYVLTNIHVIKDNEEAEIIIPSNLDFDNSGDIKPINSKLIGRGTDDTKKDFNKTEDRKFDFALLSLQTNQTLGTAVLNEVNNPISPNTNVYVSGFPGGSTQQSLRCSPMQTISAEPNYGNLLIYRPIDENNNTQPGMSGGPILNDSNKVVGIHQGRRPETGKEAQRIGIPINLIEAKFSEVFKEIRNSEPPQPEPPQPEPGKTDLDVRVQPPVNQPFQDVFSEPPSSSF